MDQNQNTSLFQLNLDAQNSYTLRSAASWAKVLGIVGLIIGGLCVVSGILVQQTLNRGGTYYNGSGISAGTLGNAGLVGYLIMAIMMFVSSMFALNAGNKIMTGLKANDQGTLNAGFAGARNYFAFWAILLILFLLLILIGLLGNLAK